MSICPYCRSRTSGNSICARCGMVLGKRDIEVHLPAVAPLQQKRLLALLTIGVPIVSVLTFVSPFVTGPLHLFLSVPVMTLATAVVVNKCLVSPIQWLLSRQRRFISRWTRRFCFYPAALWGFSAAGVPFVGAAIGALTFAGLSLGTHLYLMWNARREFAGTPLASIERVVLISAGVGAVAVLLVLLTVTAFLAWLATVIFQTG